MSIKVFVKSVLGKSRHGAGAVKRRLRRAFVDCRAGILLKSFEKKRNADRKIRVGFLAQMPEVWDKEKPVYEAMMNDDAFEPVLIVVPNRNIVTDQFEELASDNYFLTNYAEAVPARKNDSWMDLKELYLDYLFYPRCYENYLPKQYHTYNTVRFTRPCYIPYCYHVLAEPKGYYSTSFFSNTYRMFCCSQDALERVPAKFKKRSVFLGYPSLESIGGSSYDSSHPTILWMPRWTEDMQYGGTTFYAYKDKVLGLKQSSSELILRPHPLMFQNAIKSERMTPDEIDAYKERVKKSGALFDSNELIEDTFDNTDILITDLSSAIISYFLSGKPIIYCTKTDIGFVGVFSDIIECSYLAEDWDDVVRFVRNLTDGVDPLKEKREAVARKYREVQGRSAVKIASFIKEDFFRA